MPLWVFGLFLMVLAAGLHFFTTLLASSALFTVVLLIGVLLIIGHFFFKARQDKPQVLELH